MKIKTQGSTLIELMVSLVLSVVLLTLLSVIYLAMEHQSELQSSLNKVHDNSRYALQILTTEIQDAGMMGCAPLQRGFALWNATEYSLTVKNKLELTEDALGSALITVRHRSLMSGRLQAPAATDSMVVDASELKPVSGDVFLISDCVHADIFLVASVRTQGEMQTLALEQPLHYQYRENAEVGRLEINMYFVDKTDRVDEMGKDISALYMRNLDGQRTELVEGIERLKVSERVNASGLTGVSIEIQARDKKLIKTEYAFVVVPPS